MKRFRGWVMQMPPNIIVSQCKFINLGYLSELVDASEEKSKNIFFLYTSIGLDPQIEMANISASMYPICVILGSLDLSKLAFSKSGEKMVISITNKIFPL